MATKPAPIPAGQEAAIPYLSIDGVAKALAFYEKAFGARVTERVDGPGGMVMHAEIRIGKAIVMMGQASAEMNFRDPKALGGSPVTVYVYVEDVDSFCDRAVAAGATLKSPCKTQFYGDRSCGLEDPYGHLWGFATHVEDVSSEELKRRAAAMFAEGTK